MYSLVVSVFGESKYIRLSEQEINDPSEFMKTGISNIVLYAFWMFQTSNSK